METNHTAKHFVLQLGSLVSLYLSLGSLLALLFGVINMIYPDATDQYYSIEGYQSGIRYGIAMVIVFFPTYLILTRTVNKMRRSEAGGAYLSLTKWLVYLSLLIGGGVLLGDAVMVIMTFLEGEITQRFILKAFAVFFVIGAAFHYYIQDARGFWLRNEVKSVQFAMGAIVAVIASVGYGFMNIETPTIAREQKLDATEITDLQQIQWRVQDYYLANNKLPENLEALGAPAAPTAPEDRPAYRYSVTDAGFELCATFNNESVPNEYYGSTAVMEKSLIRNPDNWQHGAGEVCFERIINKDTASDTTSPAPIMKQ
jgi:hypothetical protein